MNEKYYMTWDDMFHRLYLLQEYWNDALSYFIPTKNYPVRVYGIPRGGMILASFCKGWVSVYKPELAHIIIDDIVDSGKTMKKYENKYMLDKNTHVPVVGLIDKKSNEEHKKLGWIVFPWESDKEDKEDIDDHIIRILELYGHMKPDQPACNAENVRRLKALVDSFFNFDDR